MIGGKGTYYQYLEYVFTCFSGSRTAVIAQLGERKTEDLKVSGSIPDCGSRFDKGIFSEKNMFVYDY